jgi:CheY-like chemotaxis protein
VVLVHHYFRAFAVLERQLAEHYRLPPHFQPVGQLVREPLGVHAVAIDVCPVYFRQGRRPAARIPSRRAMILAPVATSTPELLTSISHYLWPIVALFILWRLLPAIREVIRTRDFKVNVAGMSLDVQAASEGLQKQIADLQSQVAQLQRPDPSPVAASEAPRNPGEPTSFAYRTSSPTPKGPEPDINRVLWVDDEPENIAFEIQALENRGLTPRRATNTADALKALHGGQFFAVVTDMGRTEGGAYNPDAGLDLVRAVRQSDSHVRLYVYTTDQLAEERGDELREAGANGVTASSVRLLAVLGVIGSATS